MLFKRINLFLPIGLTWSREVLPGIARYAREQSDWELRLSDPLKLPGKDDMPEGMIGIFSGGSDAVCRELLEAGVKLVGVSGFQPLPYLPLVSHDDFAIGRLAARHLFEAGLRHFVAVSVEQAENHRLRVAGFIEELRERGATEPIVLAGRPEALRAALDKLPRPAGVFGVNDQRARHFEEAARDKGFRIPADFAVLGADNDIVHCELSPVPLSSISLRFEEVGYRAAEMLHRLMRGEVLEEERLRLPPLEIESRASTNYLFVEDSLVRRALTYMKQHLTDSIGGDQLADFLGVSRRHLEYRFRAATGTSINKELRKMRMETARRLLLHKPMRIQEIADAVGCNDVNRFSAYFREAFGMPPSEYRKANR